MFIGALQHGSCVVEPTALAFSTNELMDMIRRCGVNRLTQFAPFLANHLRNARLNPKVLAILQSLDQVIYSGLPLPREEEEWAYRNGINLRVSLSQIYKIIA
jgi:acyl-coenzyme A synthetase/AMP-(fatty) acid ligase